jgi:hypothetical protein
MAHWLIDDKYIIYNTLDASMNPSSVVRGLDAQLLNKYPFPVAHSSVDGRYLAGYSLERLNQLMPGYGIAGKEDKLPRFWIYDTVRNDFEFNISIHDIIKIAPQKSFFDSSHFFHHTLISPSTSYAFFLHRWVGKSSRRYTRLLIYDFHTKSIVESPFTEMCSHICWLGDSTLLAYARIGRIDGYYVYDCRLGVVQNVLNGFLEGDGHPFKSLNSSSIVTDTYPDRFSIQRLLLTSVNFDSVKLLAETRLPIWATGQLQVDMHPRLNNDGTLVAFDHIHDGKYCLSTIDISCL